jgi:hypothetical protein
MKIQQEEIFGPVCTISKFKTKADVIKIGNNTTYGLAAAVHTSNLTTAIEVANALRAGTVWVNSYNTLHWQLPFGGYKEVRAPYLKCMRHTLTLYSLVLGASWERRRWTTTSRPRPCLFVLAMFCSVKRYASFLAKDLIGTMYSSSNHEDLNECKELSTIL